MPQSGQSENDHLRMSVETFQTERAAGKSVVLLDVRGIKAWQGAHFVIPGALRAYPEVRIDPRWPKDHLFLALCDSTDEATSSLVARHLRERGYKNSYALIGGVYAWQSAGFPMEPKPSSEFRGSPHGNTHPYSPLRLVQRP